ncbi:MAG: succinate dehydrogenase cytochrome b subunit, partial [Bacteroidales bacterium]|nr:succinate dehydrogenase cytochrome b subunit [Bacteroidales bacterium]
STVGKKFWVSLTGLFLITFLVVHLIANLMLVFDDTGELFNRVVHFMGTNPIIRVMEPVLAIGFLAHIFLVTILTLRNQTTRSQNYKKQKLGHASSWASRNMYILGLVILAFLVLHIINYWWKFKFGDLPTTSYGGEEMENAYTMVSSLFAIWWYDVIYIVAFIGLAIHLSHGFWSAFQTIGWSNDKARKTWTNIAYLYVIIIGVGFTIIPVYFLLK